LLGIFAKVIVAAVISQAMWIPSNTHCLVTVR
jgi:hypothetical protein